MKIKSKLMAIMMVLMLFAFVVPAIVKNASASGALGGIWHLDEGTGTTAYDSSGNGNHGTVYGGATWTNGKIDKALEFDGVNDYVNVLDSNSLDITGKITMEAWIYPYTVSKMQVIVQKYNYSGPPYNGAYYLGVGGYGYNNKILLGLSHNGYNFYYILSNTNITANTWTHVAATSNGTHMSIYINGIRDKVAAYPPGVIYASAAPLRIGCFLPELGQPRFFNGIIDEVRVSAGTIWTVDDDRVQCPNADFTSIQAAIDKASADDTIIVHDGTYNEALYINKRLTIRAASTPVIKGGQMRATNYGNRQATIFVEDADNVILEGFDVEGQGLGVPSGTKSYAIIYENSGGIIRDCIISPNTIGDMYSAAIAAWDNSDVTIKRCMIQNFGRIGIYSNNATLSVEGNTIIGQVYGLNNLVNYGIEIEDYTGPSSAQITSNEIYNCDNTHPSPLWSSGAIIVDIWRSYYDLSPSTVSIKNNDIHDNFEAIEIVSSSLSYAHYNDIHNNRYGVWVNPDLYNNYAMFDARFNWWGDASGPNQTTTNPGGLGNDAGDYVDYSPWLGFVVGTTPMTWHANPTGAPGAIQEAVNEASTGDTILVHDGTYDEQVVLDKSLTLQGGSTPVIKPSSATILTTVLDGLFWGGTKQIASIIVANTAGASVTVKNIIIDGENIVTKPTGADYVAGVFYRETGGTIDTVTVANMTIGSTGTAVRGYGVYLSAITYSVSVEIEYCLITNYDKNAIDAHGDKLSINIHDNTLTGRGPLPNGDEVQNGVIVMDGATGKVDYNNISDMAYTPETWWSAGIMFLESDGSAEGNIITNCQIGVIFQDGSGSAQTNIVTGGTVGLLGLWAQYTTAGTWTATFVGNTISGVRDSSGYENGAIGAQSWDAGSSLVVTIHNNKILGDGSTSADGIYIGDVPEYDPAGNIQAIITSNIISGWQNGIHLVSSIGTGSIITCNNIFNNGIGIHVEAVVNVNNICVNYDNIYSNSFGLKAYGPSTLNAKYNWWGHFTGPYHSTLNPSGLGNAVSDYVSFNPWLLVEKVPPLVHDVAITQVVPSAVRVAVGTTVQIDVTAKNEGTAYENFTVTLYYDSNIIGMQTITELTPGASKLITFNWDTTGTTPGTDYTITAVASTVPGETDTTDNTKSAVDKVRVGEPPLMKAPTYQAKFLNQTVTINVTINDLKAYWRIIAIEFRLCYDDTLLQLINVTEGPFLKHFASLQPGSDGTLFLFNPDYDPIYGSSVMVGVFILPNATGYWNPPFPEGSGTIATLTFKAIYQERGLEKPPLFCELALVETDVFDDDGITIPYNVQNGLYKIWPTHIADINYDGKVDLKDYYRITRAFGEFPGRPRWDPIADLNGDQKVDLKDVYTCAKGFGWVQNPDP